MSEEMLEEVQVVTVTGENGEEEYYEEDVRIEHDGKQFCVLIPIPDEEEDEIDGDAIIARLDEEDGEVIYVAPTDEEFEAVSKKYDQIIENM
ncbi:MULTISPECIES: DUF1292 domain-containing protein [Megasphaera]|uniref:PF06949 family protein n=1 Tax=Megasphaera vaginalis (ex Srinivasan et al. 2021) TaxID=1111454 RepID=U7UHE3_9FIRM|nr:MULTISPECIES: DUF1292 domain-containing protein [Megasphaera]ERT57878.1 PF06949 family protein [Megasphaera vaginalis (ex Srinivasan et al. 2021)]